MGAIKHYLHIVKLCDLPQIMKYIVQRMDLKEAIALEVWSTRESRDVGVTDEMGDEDRAKPRLS